MKHLIVVHIRESFDRQVQILIEKKWFSYKYVGTAEMVFDKKDGCYRWQRIHPKIIVYEISRFGRIKDHIIFESQMLWLRLKHWKEHLRQRFFREANMNNFVSEAQENIRRETEKAEIVSKLIGIMAGLDLTIEDGISALEEAQKRLLKLRISSMSVGEKFEQAAKGIYRSLKY